MRRSAYITWDQLKVGLVVVAAIAVLTLAVFKLGQAANLFSRRYTLVTFLADANGLRQGGSVMIAGQLVGTVKEIELLPVDSDTTRNLRIVARIDTDVRDQIRGDSKAKLRSLGLLGDKVLDISPGTPRYAVLQEGDTIRSIPAMDYDAVIAQAAGAVDDVVLLTRDLRTLTGGLVRGEGTVGQLFTNRGLYDQFQGTMARTNAMLVRLQNPNGSIGRLIDDPRLYNNTVRMVASMDSLVRAVSSSEGTLGRLLRDDTLYTRFVSIAANADSVMKLVHSGDGLASRLLTDQTLYDQLSKLTTNMNAVLEDVRRNPSRYTRGLVNFGLFGSGGKKEEKP
ncbi:MAG TPA: MlaD family protein [Gemmatimonadaceae bacterium]|nr:MlaD family protein [Gemmatimonadaceae bacterium]